MRAYIREVCQPCAETENNSTLIEGKSLYALCQTANKWTMGHWKMDIWHNPNRLGKPDRSIVRGQKIV